MRQEDRYRGRAIVRPLASSQTAGVQVHVDLYWCPSPSWRNRSGRLSGTVTPASGAEGSTPPTGPVVLQLPDGYEAIGELGVRRAADTADWFAFRGAAPYIPAADRGLDGHYLVSIALTIGWVTDENRSPEFIIETLSSRVGFTTTRAGPGWFCADLTDAQRDRIRHELHVGYVAQETEDHPAPCFRVPPPDGIESEFMVLVREGVDPADVAARLDVVPSMVLRTAINIFAARLTEAQIARIRHDPDVVELQQNVRVYPD